MNDPGGEMPVCFSGSKLTNPTSRNESPSGTKENTQKTDQLFDIANCRVETYLEGLMAECLTTHLCPSCGYSIPFAKTFFCKHPKLVKIVPE
jgi:hypothetical protein